MSSSELLIISFLKSSEIKATLVTSILRINNKNRRGKKVKLVLLISALIRLHLERVNKILLDRSKNTETLKLFWVYIRKTIHLKLTK